MRLSYLDRLRCLNLFYEKVYGNTYVTSYTSNVGIKSSNKDANNQLEVRSPRSSKRLPQVPLGFLAFFLDIPKQKVKYFLLKSNWFLIKKVKVHRKCGKIVLDHFDDQTRPSELYSPNKTKSLETGCEEKRPVFYCHSCTELYLESDLTIKTKEWVVINHNCKSVKFWFAIFRIMDLIDLARYWFMYLAILVYLFFAAHG